ncbi:MAG TPA: hypothetical protein DEG71_04980 [Clostridiales bacterium]|nr:hypothetical protein [Clostridiales bacterium]
MKYILFDLESTCWEKGSDDRQASEIIEIGAVVLDEIYNVLDTFHSFIRPTISPVLSEYSLTLNNIKQEEVNTAPIFSTVFMRFENWIFNYKENGQTTLIAWSPSDKRTLQNDISRKLSEKVVKRFFDEFRYFDLQKKFAEKIGKPKKQYSIVKALKTFGLEYNGISHKALNDVINMVEILKRIKY